MSPFAYLISGSVVALITLRKGTAFGLQTIIGSLLVLLFLSLLAGLPASLSLAYALVIWLPVWLSSTSLRLSEMQGLLLLTVGMLVISLILATYIVVDDVTGWWQEWLDIMLEKLVPPDQLVRYQEALKPASDLINAMMAVGLMLNILMSVLCGRWWQSRLFNQGAFRKEFYALRLPAVILLVSAFVVVLMFVVTEQWQGMLRDILIVMIFMYLIQGISSVHRSVDKYKLSTGWLVAMYVLLILLPHMGLFIACLGMTDVYMSWRRKNNGAGIES